MGVIMRLRDMKAKTQTESQISKFIIENPHAVLGMNSTQLAEKCYTSPSSIVRLSKRIGLSGYPEMKIKLAAELKVFDEQRLKIHENRELRQGDTIEDVIAKITAIHIDSIRETEMLMEPRILKQVILSLAKTIRIDFYGVGASHVVALDAQDKFMRLGKVTSAFVDPYQQFMQAVTADQNTVAFVISYSGETAEIIRVCRKLRENGATIVAITGTNHNPLSQIADYKLYISSTETKFRSAATSSRIVMLTLIDMIYNAYANEYCQEVMVQLTKTQIKK
ncbi:MAG: MurR/RpiR family transcriptional regulator [Culicoidibacterales bacterium]